MRFAFTDDQLLFRDTVRDFLQKEHGPDKLREQWDGDGSLSSAWRGLADMGVMGLTVAEAHGGLGMDELDLVLLLEETGRVALADPIAETVAVAAPLFAALSNDVADADRWSAGVASGELVVSTNLGGPLAPRADVAGLFVLDEGDRLVAVDVEHAARSWQESVDGSRRLARIRCESGDAVLLAEGDDARSLVAAAHDRGALAAAAQLIGLADHLIAATVDYAKQREQFGVPIGSFQAIKHHLTNATLAVEFARPVVYRAAYSLAGGDADASRDVSMAKCAASDAATLAARIALQCHGAIAYTVEYDLHMWMKRVWALAAAWGDAAHHRERVAVAVLGPHP